MVLTSSTMMDLGMPAPDFSLSDVVSGQTLTLHSFSDKKALLVMFICRHCPYVIHVQEELAAIGRDYQATGLGILAISANDAEHYPQDAPQNLKAMALELGFNFPYCHDETQDVAKAYGAVCTPDFFLFDANRKLVYRGQLDDSRPNSTIPVSGRDLRAAIDSLLSGREIQPDQKPSIGCNIKWRQSD